MTKVRFNAYIENPGTDPENTCKYIKDEGFKHKGRFHRWASSSNDSTYGIIEDKNGLIHIVDCIDIQFITKKNKISELADKYGAIPQDKVFYTVEFWESHALLAISRCKIDRKPTLTIGKAYKVKNWNNRELFIIDNDHKIHAFNNLKSRDHWSKYFICIPRTPNTPWKILQ